MLLCASRKGFKDATSPKGLAVARLILNGDVGNSENDIIPGKLIGAKTILLHSGSKRASTAADFVIEDLSKLYDIIV